MAPNILQPHFLTTLRSGVEVGRDIADNASVLNRGITSRLEVVAKPFLKPFFETLRHGK